jgi:hypothetical protein
MIRRTVWCKLDEDGTLVALAGQNEFEVFKADLEHSRWIKVTTLGDDLVVFLGRRCSRAVSASQYGMLGDQIFFLDDIMENVVEYFFDGESTSVDVYDMRTIDVQMGSARWVGTDTARLNMAHKRHGTVCPVSVPGTARPPC